jgi:hypothetical protein
MTTDTMLALLIVAAQSVIIVLLYRLVQAIKDYTETSKLTVLALSEVARIARANPDIVLAPRVVDHTSPEEFA